jgi:hypothetical protein
VPIRAVLTIDLARTRTHEVDEHILFSLKKPFAIVRLCAPALKATVQFGQSRNSVDSAGFPLNGKMYRNMAP